MNRSVMVLQGSLQVNEKGERYLRVLNRNFPGENQPQFLARENVSFSDLAPDLETNREYEIKIIFKPVECPCCHRARGHNSLCQNNDANARN